MAEPTREERLRLLYEPCRNKLALRNHIKYFLNIDLPDGIVDENSTSCAMDFVWDVYHAMHTGTGPTKVVVAASRNTAKTLTACIIRFYGMIHFRRDGTHLAAVKTQSDSATGYLNKMLRIDGVNEFLHTDNTRDKKLTNLPPNSYTTRGECTLRVAVATMNGVNSQRGSLNIKDEVDLVPAAILSESSFIADPTMDEHQFDPIEVYLSSRKTNSGPIQRLLDEADTANNPKIMSYKWSWADWMRKCEADVSKIQLPKVHAWMHAESLQVVWDEAELKFTSDAERQLFQPIIAHEGCRTCPAFIACQGRAVKQTSTSRMLRTTSFIADRITDAGDSSSVIAQGLNLKPESSAVVFRQFNKRFHFIKPVEFYKWCFGEYYCPEGVPIEDVLAIVRSKSAPALLSITPTKQEIYNQLRRAGWRIHYGVDWGSVDPAVCLIVGYHRPTRRMIILHTSAMHGYPNEDWAKFVNKNIFPLFPCDLVCPDMADINSPIYFGRLQMPCRDEKPARIEPGVSQIRSFLWNPATQQTHFAMLDDGDMGLNKWTAECFEKWTYKKNVMGYDFKHFEDNEYTHPLDSLRYAADPWIADLKTTIMSKQPKNEVQVEVAAALGDKDAQEKMRAKTELKQQLKEHFNDEHGLANVFTTEDRMSMMKAPADKQRGWQKMTTDPNSFIDPLIDPSEAEPLSNKPKSRIRFKF